MTILQDIPIYAKVVKDGQIISKATNTRTKTYDITGHAEINALRQAAIELNTWNLDGCELYSTLEPCLMCIAAIMDSKISKLYYAAFDKKAGACGSVWNIPADGRTRRHLEVYGGVVIDGLSALEHSQRVSRFFQHSIRSYANRSNKLPDKYALALKKYQKDYLINLNQLKNNLVKWTEQYKKIILEIGSGQGKTIVQAAISEPETLFIGSEVYLAGLAHTVYSAHMQSLDNCKLYNGDVNNLLQIVPDNFFQDIWYFFPDPWPKRKHHKRRLIN
ncbi:MAG: hypothetical protein LBT99_04830, partial [Bifidobacteriaceae bacterium]|nr:hypothetical protein [Bifidobacteriaceae bacterium]